MPSPSACKEQPGTHEAKILFKVVIRSELHTSDMCHFKILLISNS